MELSDPVKPVFVKVGGHGSDFRLLTQKVSLHTIARDSPHIFPCRVYFVLGPQELESYYHLLSASAMVRPVGLSENDEKYFSLNWLGVQRTPKAKFSAKVLLQSGTFAPKNNYGLEES